MTHSAPCFPLYGSLGTPSPQSPVKMLDDDEWLFSAIATVGVVNNLTNVSTTSVDNLHQGQSVRLTWRSFGMAAGVW